jgi:colanic acid biosynthesis glycosyl transferase WcaI
MKWIDRRIACSCRSLIVISDRFAEIYRYDRGVLAQRVHVIPNWVDPQNIHLLPRDQFRRSCGIPEDAFVFVYGGNIGVAAGVEAAIEAFSKVKKDRVYLLIAGDGTQRTACENLVAKSRIRNVIFHHPWPADETSEVLAAADILLLPTHGEQSLASVPSKMLNYMLAGRPILTVAAHGSDIEKIMNEAQCGWQVQPGNTDALIETLNCLSEISIAELIEKGDNGRKYVLENFSSDVCLPEAVRIILSAAQK